MKPIECYEIELHHDFDKQVRRLAHKKKFYSLPSQVDDLIEKFEKGDFEGILISHSDTPANYDVYKLRMPNPDAKAGKADGYRVIYLVVTDEKIVVLLTIYYKKEQADITDTYIKWLIDGYFLGALPYDDV